MVSLLREMSSFPYRERVPLNCKMCRCLAECGMCGISYNYVLKRMRSRGVCVCVCVCMCVCE